MSDGDRYTVSDLVAQMRDDLAGLEAAGMQDAARAVRRLIGFAATAELHEQWAREDGQDGLW